jgi:hypothetical protein
MSRSTSWPVSDTRRLPAAPARPRRQRFPRVAWVLAFSAFLCGAMVSAAVFAVGWKHEAQRGSSAQTALLAATARNHRLAGAVASARAAALRAHNSARRADAQATAVRGQVRDEIRTLQQRTATLSAALASAGTATGAVVGGASSVGTELSQLTSELHTLTTYLTTTPSRQLDSGYVASQTAYITKSIDRIEADANSLAATAAAAQKAASAGH